MELKFTLTEKEAELIIQVLAKQPYEIVYGLISKIQGQALTQVEEKGDGVGAN